MCRFLVLLLLTKLIVSFVALEADAGEPATYQNLTYVSNGFTCTIYNTIMETYQQFTNNMMSAINILEAMLVLTNAAQPGSQTQKQLTNLSRISSSDDSLRDINCQFKNFLDKIQSNQTEDHQCEFYAALYMQKGCPLNSQYKSGMKCHYEAVVNNVDFKTNSTAVTKDINDAVNNKTHGLINGVYSEPLPPDTRIVMIATIYFYSRWHNQFFVLNNYTSPFYYLPKGSMQLKYITNNGKKPAGYAVVDSCQVASIPYTNNCSLYVFLPQSGKDPKTCLTTLTPSKIAKLNTDTAYKQAINVTMPRFKYDTTLNMIPYFQKLGVKQPFIEAELGRGINQNNCGNLYVSSVIHKAVIEVNEEGTKAAAVTAIGVTSLAMPSQPLEPIQFMVNRSFAFAIVCTDMFLFSGCCYKPNYSE